MRPSTSTPPPQWSLQLVFRQLSGPPFEPMASCSDLLLSLKLYFLSPLRQRVELQNLQLSVVTLLTCSFTRTRLLYQRTFPFYLRCPQIFTSDNLLFYLPSFRILHLVLNVVSICWMFGGLYSTILTEPHHIDLLLACLLARIRHTEDITSLLRRCLNGLHGPSH